MAVKIKIDDKLYGLRLDMYAMEQIETEFGSVDNMLQKMEGNSINAIGKLFKIMANAYLAYIGQEETVTGQELKRLRVAAVRGAGIAIRAAIDEGMKSETIEGEEADDEVYDVYLAEIEAKN